MTTIQQTAAGTPLILLQYLPRGGRVFVKLESMNPSGSIKDRVALQFVRELKGKKHFGRETTVVTASSGNIGVSFAMMCAAEYIKLIVVMPANMSIERRLLIQQYGASLVLTDLKLGLRGAMYKAAYICQSHYECVLFDQFASPIPFRAHELQTGPEMVKYCNLAGIRPRYFTSGIGSGATLCGCASVFSRAFPDIQIIGVETGSDRRGGDVKLRDELSESKKQVLADSMSWKEPTEEHYITGISPGFISANYNKSLVHRFISIPESDALRCTKLLARQEGIIAGPSSGANVAAAVQIASNENCDVITIIPDAGERYLSIQGLYDDMSYQNPSD